MLKVAKEYIDFKGFKVKPLSLYGTVYNLDIVITSVPYTYTESTDEIHLWILENGKWTLQYIDAYLLKEGELDLGGFRVDLLDFIKAMQWTREPSELEYIYSKSPLPPVVINAYRAMFNLFTIDEIFDME